MTSVYDLVGVGIGPFNLSLAALGDQIPELSIALFDENFEFAWHPGLLIDGTTLQVPFLADLVTMVDPTNPWSFLSYLRAHERLYPFYFKENFHVSRREYSHYCRWVADSLASCSFGKRVIAVEWVSEDEVFRVAIEDVRTAKQEWIRTRNVVLGVGTDPVIPEAFQNSLGKEVFHAASYLDQCASLRGAQDITVVGSGQSGAEVLLDLMKAQTTYGYKLRWLTRSPAFAPMEYSKLGLEHFTPDYMRYFQGLSQEKKDGILPRQWQLYKASSAGTLAEIHDILYERGFHGDWPDVALMPNVAVTGLERSSTGLDLACRQGEQDREFEVTTERVILATGYAPSTPSCLDGISELVQWDQRGRYQVDSHYRVALEPTIGGGLYVQNAETHTHGVGAPDLGMGAYRAAVILNAVANRSLHPLPARTAFTKFGGE